MVGRNANAFTSCIPEAPDELEIPPSMMAWASTVVSILSWIDFAGVTRIKVHAILEQATGQTNKFGEKYEGIFRRHVVVLEALRSQKPVIYHKFAHEIYMDAS